MAVSWYPQSLVAQIPWWSTFNTECNNYKTTFASILTSPTLTKIGAAKDLVVALADGADQAKNYASDLIAYQQIWLSSPLGTAIPAVPSLPTLPTIPVGAVVGCEALARLVAGQLKADPAMTPAIAAALGIAPPAGSLGDPVIQTVQALGSSNVRLRMKKAGYPALQISGKRGGGDWEVLAVSLNATWTDTRGPLTPGESEVRHYRVQGFLDNIAQGTVSAEKSIATTP